MWTYDLLSNSEIFFEGRVKVKKDKKQVTLS